jgi:uncharacterized protein
MSRPLTVNLRHMAQRDLRLEGALGPEELELVGLDAMVRVSGAVAYSLRAQKLEQSLLVRGRLVFALECVCVRCLKTFSRQVDLPEFAVDVPLVGEEAAAEGDFVDLTPYVREDILLAFPQHPLCEPGCVGLSKPAPPASEAQPGKESQMTSSVWAALNELKL